MGSPEWEETKKAARSMALQAELFDVRSEEDPTLITFADEVIE
jgi:hypothetical protein